MVRYVITKHDGQNAKPPTLIVHDDPVPIRIDKGGAVRVGPTRVTLEVLLHYYKRGYPPEKIQDNFPTLHLADIYSVIGYYLRHTEEVDEFLRQSEVEAEEIRREIEAYQKSDDFQARRQASRATRQK